MVRIVTGCLGVNNAKAASKRRKRRLSHPCVRLEGGIPAALHFCVVNPEKAANFGCKSSRYLRILDRPVRTGVRASGDPEMVARFTMPAEWDPQGLKPPAVGDHAMERDWGIFCRGVTAPQQEIRRDCRRRGPADSR